MPPIRDVPIFVKAEPEDNDARVNIPENLADGNDFEEDEFLEDAEGHHYYADEGFKIKQVAPATVVQRTLLDLYRLSKTPYLKLDPEYQRDVVWDETRASGLISSVMQGYFIPPVIFNVISRAEKDTDGKKIVRHYRICVDGKQRLTSLQKFVEGKICITDSSAPPKKWYYDHPLDDGVRMPSTHNILPQSTRAFFNRRTFCCYEYADLNESVEENMFQLVQRGMPLTIAERLRAMSTKWATFAKQYEQDYAMVVGLCKQGRASGFRAVITIFCQILEVSSPSGKGKNREGVGHKPVLASSPAILIKLLRDDQSLDEGTKAKLKQVFDKFQVLYELSSARSNLTKSGRKIKANTAFDPAPDYLNEHGVGHVKTFSPIELLATAILLSVHMTTRTDQMLIGDIKELRHYLRENHKDLRINQLCWATVWEYIDNVMIQRRGGKGAVLRHRDGRHEQTSLSDNEAESDEERASTPGMDTEQASPYFMVPLPDIDGQDESGSSNHAEDRISNPTNGSLPRKSSGTGNNLIKRARELAAAKSQSLHPSKRVKRAQTSAT